MSKLFLLLAQKNLLGLVQGATARVDVEFRDARGARHTKTAVVKAKNGDTEELPLYTNHDDILGEVRGMSVGRQGVSLHALASMPPPPPHNAAAHCSRGTACAAQLGLAALQISAVARACSKEPIRAQQGTLLVVSPAITGALAA